MTRCYYCDALSDERICATCMEGLNRRSSERIRRNGAKRFRRREQDEHIEVEARGGKMEEHRE